ncbi:hypothetical protein BDF14DRAFT_1880430 [Spinellus fusiger]|nr:hypothetical protein BDF14DRAFT_1880430 [Spinellus fusiger]
MLSITSSQSTQSLHALSTKIKRNKLTKYETVAALDTLCEQVEMLTMRVGGLERVIEKNAPYPSTPCQYHGPNPVSHQHTVDPWASNVPVAYSSLVHHLGARGVSSYSLPTTSTDPLDTVYAHWNTLAQCLPQMEPEAQQHVRAVALYAMRDILDSKRILPVDPLEAVHETVRKRADGWLPSSHTQSQASSPQPMSPPTLQPTPLTSHPHSPTGLVYSPSLPALHPTKDKSKRWFQKYRRNMAGAKSQASPSACSWEGFDKKLSAWLDARDHRRPTHPVL